MLRSKAKKADAVSETGLHADYLALQVQLGFSQPQRDVKRVPLGKGIDISMKHPPGLRSEALRPDHRLSGSLDFY